MYEIFQRKPPSYYDENLQVGNGENLQVGKGENEVEMQFYGFLNRSSGLDRRGSEEIQRLICWTFQESFSYSLEQSFIDNRNLRSL